jgi:hypothetical protein
MPSRPSRTPRTSPPSSRPSRKPYALTCIRALCLSFSTRRRRSSSRNLRKTCGRPRALPSPRAPPRTADPPPPRLLLFLARVLLLSLFFRPAPVPEIS